MVSIGGRGGILAFLGGCKAVDVNVGTKDPLKVEMDMEVHVYQHGEKDEASEKARANYKDVMASRRNRMAEIQELKNNRLVGETHEGLLSVRTLPAGDYGDYVKKTVAAENDDREFMMNHEAQEKGTPVDEVRRQQWRHWQRKSFPGEWIEVEGEQPGSHLWMRKEGASEEN